MLIFLLPSFAKSLIRSIPSKRFATESILLISVSYFSNERAFYFVFSRAAAIEFRDKRRSFESTTKWLQGICFRINQAANKRR